jgi:hypothetical protein
LAHPGNIMSPVIWRERRLGEVASSIISYVACYALRGGPAELDLAATSGATSCCARPSRASPAAGHPESRSCTSIVAYRPAFVKRILAPFPAGRKKSNN